MTRPGVTSLDDIPVYEIDGMVWPATVPGRDQLGREWLIVAGGDKGFLTPAAPRARREDRPDSDGAFAGFEPRSAKTRTLAGRVWVPRTQRDRTELELASLCQDSGRLYPLRRRTGYTDLVAEVKLDADPQWEWTTRRVLDFSFSFWAPDPRLHDNHWQESSASPAIATLSGLEYSDGGLAYTNGGLDYGAAGQLDSPAQLANYGTATARPYFELRGPQPAPVIADAQTGKQLRYLDDLVAGETVALNCDDFPARGLPPRSAMSTRRGDVTSLWVVTDWPEVPGQGVASYRLVSAGTPDSMTAALRSAYR